jgi:hypothetical protein
VWKRCSCRRREAVCGAGKPPGCVRGGDVLATAAGSKRKGERASAVRRGAVVARRWRSRRKHSSWAATTTACGRIWQALVLANDGGEERGVLETKMYKSRPNCEAVGAVF